MACGSWLMNLGFAASATAATGAVEMSYTVIPSNDPDVLRRNMGKLNRIFEKLVDDISDNKRRLDTGGL